MIERHDGKNQVCCNTCPASYPNTYADEDFAVMIADAKTAGRPGHQDQPYTHTCPHCAAEAKIEGRLF